MLGALTTFPSACSTSLTAFDLIAFPHSLNGIFASDPPIDMDATMEDELREKEDGVLFGERMVRGALIGPHDGHACVV
ncbi:hypothetical protein Zm00014a_013251 [Zea mays]|uniref:Uncharacterized protein n=1 Tax=Zea mays TaxID=4577 RepID=A0A3L6FXI3_MAIZE|nr:hypothetical protein Zm00014a_013251 [Zea mays]